MRYVVSLFLPFSLSVSLSLFVSLFLSIFPLRISNLNFQDAYRLFLTAAEHESIGDMSQAVKFYRRAHKMDPDVEKKHKAITLNKVQICANT